MINSPININVQITENTILSQVRRREENEWVYQGNLGVKQADILQIGNTNTQSEKRLYQSDKQLICPLTRKSLQRRQLSIKYTFNHIHKCTSPSDGSTCSLYKTF